MPSVLVTGANRGIGLAITRHLSARGWDVYATARSEGALAELGTMPGVHPTRPDITDRASLDALAAQLPAELDGVVNNAGITFNGPVEGLTLDDLSRQLEVNVTAQIGVGGMGEVYRATDTKLKRQVAIKVLPETVAADPDRLR